MEGATVKEIENHIKMLEEEGDTIAHTEYLTIYDDERAGMEQPTHCKKK